MLQHRSNANILNYVSFKIIYKPMSFNFAFDCGTGTHKVLLKC